VLLLAFDTATPAVTVALHDGAGVVAAQAAVDARRHGELLAASIETVLRTAGAGRGDLTAVAVGTGPGPYTGLRAGLITARVLGRALGIRVDGICSLDIIAAAADPAPPSLIVATDARRKELYWARYGPGPGRPRERGPEVCPVTDLVAELAGDLPVAGEGAWLYPELAAAPAAPRYPDAAVLAALGAARIARGDPPGPPDPLYLRRPDAREPGQRKRVTP
jgi:tRNA threonylcarbamoyl adenosine modification protein YeaZ